LLKLLPFSYAELGTSFPSLSLNEILFRGIIKDLRAFELLKARFNAAQGNNIYYYRDRAGLEVDFILDHGIGCDAVEVKSAATVHPDFVRNLRVFSAASGTTRHSYLLYGGEDRFDFLGARVVPWRSFASVMAET